MPKNIQLPAPAPQAPQFTSADVIATDEHAGKGGSYVFDPVTGKRTPVEQPDDAPVPLVPQPEVIPLPTE